ncbi:hypothetical protein CIW52_25945 [Mycolicibacterium sp. P9-64]|nr:hypothetical protein CIW52_25945 [Mycolicibacterium sp. P9-64]
MMYDILEIDIRGDVEQSSLERLRTHLNLKKFGRLTDDWDQQFGYRKIERANGQYTKVASPGNRHRRTRSQGSTRHIDRTPDHVTQTRCRGTGSSITRIQRRVITTYAHR